MPLANSPAAMLIHRSILVAVCLLLAMPVWAEDAPKPLPPISDVVYKGVVGKALDAVPMDPGERVILQRTNAVVSGTLSVRTLAAWAGLAHPVLLVAGLAWGVFAALNINVPEVIATPDTNRGEPIGPTQIALLPAPPVQEATEAAR